MDVTSHISRHHELIRLPRYGYLGLLILLLGELLLSLHVPLIAVYFTPVMWTGYILFLDAITYRVYRRSFIKSSPRVFVAMLFWSILCWLIFEAYNLRLSNWSYSGLPDEAVLQWIGYGWSFATIFPAVLGTADFFYPMLRRSPESTFARQTIPRAMYIVAGAACLILPLILGQPIAAKLFVLVWVGFFLLLDPINDFLGGRSILREMKAKDFSLLFALTLSGLVCGLLWEFWNYWAAAKWHYHVPLSFAGPKIFEMPLLGFLGFIPFAYECYAMEEFLVALFPSSVRPFLVRSIL